MNIFKRIFRIGQAEIHAVVDKMEDPIKMTEQGIREMKEDLDQAMEAYAKVKALAIRIHNAADEKRELAADYENKAVLLLQKLQKEEIEVIGQMVSLYLTHFDLYKYAKVLAYNGHNDEARYQLWLIKQLYNLDRPYENLLK